MFGKINLALGIQAKSGQNFSNPQLQNNPTNQPQHKPNQSFLANPTFKKNIDGHKNTQKA